MDKVQVSGNTPAWQLLRTQEQAIYEKLLGNIPAAQLAEFVENATENPSWYGADDNTLSFCQQQGIMALVSIRGLYSLLPPPRAIPMPEDAKLSQIAIQALMAGAFFGSAFPEQLRDRESVLVARGLKFAASCKKKRADRLSVALTQILAECREHNGSFPLWHEVLKRLPRGKPGFEVDYEDVTIYWTSNGRPKKTSFHALQKRLTTIRQQLSLIE